MLVDIVCLVIQLYVIAIILRMVLSWFPLSRDGVLAQVVRVLMAITEPVLGPLRRVIPLAGPLDLSPLLLIIALQIVQFAIC
jgi:YggT family protein